MGRQDRAPKGEERACPASPESAPKLLGGGPHPGCVAGPNRDLRTPGTLPRANPTPAQPARGSKHRGPREHRRPLPGQPPTQGSVPKAWQLPLVLILGPEMYHKVTCCCLGKLEWHGACNPLSEHGAQSTERTRDQELSQESRSSRARCCSPACCWSSEQVLHPWASFPGPQSYHPPLGT